MGSALLVGILLLSGCFAPKTYERPTLQTEALFRTDQIADSTAPSLDAASMAQVSWRSLFTDNLLNGYIEQALNNNLDIRIALQSIEAAAAQVKQSKAAFWPTVGVEADASRVKLSEHTPSGALNSGPLTNYQLDGFLSWEADLWGKIRSQRRAAEASYLGTVEAHKAVKTRLVANVASMYYQLMALSEQMEIAQETVLKRDSSLSIIRSLMEAGQQTQVAVEQMRAQVYDAQLILLNLQDQERVLENAFCLLLNEPPHRVPRNRLSEQRITTPLSTGVPVDLLANRPDLRQAEYGLIQAFEMTNVAKAQFYPSLTVSAAGGLQSADIDHWLDLHSLFSSVAGNLLQPVFHRRQIRTAHEVAQARQEQALLSYRKALLIAGNDVSNALFDYQTQTGALALQRSQFEALDRAADLSQELLVNGLANYLEVLTVQQSALAAQLNLTRVRARRLQAIVDLYQALGGGWQ